VGPVAVEAVEVLLDDEDAAPGDQEGVHLGRVHRVHRRVDEVLHEALDGGAIDAGVVEGADRPAVGSGWRRRVGIAGRVAAARVEAAVRVAAAAELVGASAQGEVERVGARVVGAAGDDLVLARAERAADEMDRGAALLDAGDAGEDAGVALRVAEERGG
jgi:hypothetical protein